MQFFFQKNNKKFATLDDALTAACEGLIYISETDAPVLPFCGEQADGVTGETIIHQTESPAETPVQETSFDAFFGRLTAEMDWYDEQRKARAKKFLELQKLLEENLSDLKVFKLGKIRLDVFALGRDKDGRLMGITTKAVET